MPRRMSFIMAVHKWRRRRTKHFGEVWIPFAHIEIQGANGHYQAFSLQIDSGAVVSLLRRSVADLLEVDLASGRRIQLGSVGAGPTVAYVHDLLTRFADSIVHPVPFAIADRESVPNLLGRLGVFDRLQFDFDPSLEETLIMPPWLGQADRKIWEFLLDTERHILDRWDENDLPEPAGEVANRFIRRGEQLLAAAVGLMKLHRDYAGPPFVRSLFELALQFEYLMQDPVPRAREYLDFAHITRYERFKTITQSPHGQVSRQLASDLNLKERRDQLKIEYDRVHPRFFHRNKGGGGRVARNWYGKSIRSLADEVGWLGEYKLLYATSSDWLHGDPFSTEFAVPLVSTDPSILLRDCIGYYARMLLRVSERIILTAEQHDALKMMAEDMS